jgi:uncharacterized protein
VPLPRLDESGTEGRSAAIRHTSKGGRATISLMTDNASRIAAPLLAAIGVAAGVLSGLFGVGGGIVMVPALVVAGLSQHRSQATSLAAIVPIALVGAILFGRANSIDLGAAVVLSAGSLVGARTGALLMHRLSGPILSRIFGAFLVVVAITMLLS